MFIMIDGKQKMYVGGIKDPAEAGSLYDRAAIQLKGSKVSSAYVRRRPTSHTLRHKSLRL